MKTLLERSNKIILTELEALSSVQPRVVGRVITNLDSVYNIKNLQYQDIDVILNLPKVKEYAVENDFKSVSVGQMVSWNSSGGRAEGRVRRIIRNGSYNVPDSDFTITGTPDSPAVVIELYRDGKPTGRMVGHKMETLTAKKSLWSGVFDPRSRMMKRG